MSSYLLIAVPEDYISQSCITIAKLKVFVIVVHVSRGQLQENQHVKDSRN